MVASLGWQQQTTLGRVNDVITIKTNDQRVSVNLEYAHSRLCILTGHLLAGPEAATADLINRLPEC